MEKIILIAKRLRPTGCGGHLKRHTMPVLEKLRGNAANVPPLSAGNGSNDF